MFTQILFVVGLPWIGVAGKLGPSHVVYWLLAIVTFYIPSAAVVIFLNTRMPLEGGLYQWAKFGFNPFIGFMTGWNLWLYVIVLTSESGLQITTSLAYALGPDHASLASNKLAITVISCVMMGLLVWVSVIGLGVGKWLHNAGGISIVAIFLAIIFFALRSPHFHPFTLTAPAVSLFGLNILSKMGFGALGGFEYVAILAGECRHPARSIARSVIIAAPIIAAMFILGTASMIALVPVDKIDLIGPVAQVLSVGAQPFGIAARIVPVAIFLVIGLRVAQASVNFTGNTRLPMVAGWDHLLPEWFTRLDPKHRTPVNSILFAGAATLAMGLASLAGVGHQEAFQLLWNGGATFYAIPYVIMFAIPLFSKKIPGVPVWLRVAALSGFLMTILNIGFSVLPIIDVKNSLLFTAKISGVILGGNVAGVLLFVCGAGIMRHEHVVLVVSGAGEGGFAVDVGGDLCIRTNEAVLGGLERLSFCFQVVADEDGFLYFGFVTGFAEGLGLAEFFEGGHEGAVEALFVDAEGFQGGGVVAEGHGSGEGGLDGFIVGVDLGGVFFVA